MSIVRCWAALGHNPVNEFNEPPFCFLFFFSVIFLIIIDLCFLSFFIFFFLFEEWVIDLIVWNIFLQHALVPLAKFMENGSDHRLYEKGTMLKELSYVLDR